MWTYIICFISEWRIEGIQFHEGGKFMVDLSIKDSMVPESGGMRKYDNVADHDVRGRGNEALKITEVMTEH